MFTTKSKGLFVQVRESSLMLAQTNHGAAPMQIQAVEEVSRNELDKVDQLFNQNPKKPVLIPAVCSAYPEGYYLHRVNQDDPKKLRDDHFINQVLKNELKVDPDKHAIALINPVFGNSFSSESNSDRKLMIAGAPLVSIEKVQDLLVGCNFFPRRLELAPLAETGAIRDILRKYPDKDMGPVLMIIFTPRRCCLTIVNDEGLDLSRILPHGINTMIPVLQKAMNLPDEESAKNLLFSETMNFEEIGEQLLSRITRELNNFIGYYEVHTGTSIRSIHISGLPANFQWIPTQLASSLGLEPFEPDLQVWLETTGVTLAQDVAPRINMRWLPLLATMCPLASDE